ncbi:MAG TPA: hypothetical protein PLL33_11235 [Paracoccus sp. (in: a-proteobacteria)]|nr:hypothetical protein [Paracoccus sp. (in: a-proteobacteria)]
MSRVVVLVLALWAVALSSLAGNPAAAFAVDGNSVVLCSEQGAVPVVLGPDGTPVDPDSRVRHCPECLPLPQPAALPGPDAALPMPAATCRAVRLTATAIPVVARAMTLPPVRGPPQVI